MNKLMTGFVVGTLALAVLFESTGVGLALPKTRPGHHYCDCQCKNDGPSVGAELIWEKVASCGLNGRSCSFKNSTGGLEPGTLSHCLECVGDAGGGLGSCNLAMTQQPGQVAPPQAPTLQPPTSPGMTPMPGTVAPGMTHPIVPRSIEGAQFVEPPPGAPEPSEQPSGKKSE